MVCIRKCKQCGDTFSVEADDFHDTVPVCPECVGWLISHGATLVDIKDSYTTQEFNSTAIVATTKSLSLFARTLKELEAYFV